MLAYYKGGFNQYTVRVEQIPSGSTYLVIYTEDMTTQDTWSAVFSPNQWTYNEYESIASFSYNFDGTQPPPPVGTQYRAKLAAWQSGSGQSLDANIIWHGSFSVFQSQSINKPDYTNQIPLSGSISHDTLNEYIILQ